MYRRLLWPRLCAVYIYIVVSYGARVLDTAKETGSIFIP